MPRLAYFDLLTWRDQCVNDRNSQNSQYATDVTHKQWCGLQGFLLHQEDAFFFFLLNSDDHFIWERVLVRCLNRHLGLFCRLRGTRDMHMVLAEKAEDVGQTHSFLRAAGGLPAPRESQVPADAHE